MKTPKIVLGFTRFTDADFDTLARHIDDSLDSNPNFPVLNPDGAIRSAAVIAYTQSLAVAEGLGRVNVAEKKANRKLLEGILKQTGLDVMNIANGNEATLATSGFPFVKPADSKPMGNPGNVTISNGTTSGELVVFVKAVEKAKSYLHEITDIQPGENTAWTTSFSTSCKYAFKSLQPGKQYWVRVGAVGTKQQVTYSPVSTQFAQ